MNEYSRQTESMSNPDLGRESSGDGSSQVRERAQEYGDQARERAREYGDQAQQKAEEGKDQAAGGMERAADMVRQRAPESGMAAEAGTKAADAMENAAGYLRSRDTTEMWNDVESFAKSHPGQALAGAIFAGFVLGRIIR